MLPGLPWLPGLLLILADQPGLPGLLLHPMGHENNFTQSIDTRYPLG